jgi:hypothetical protein
MAPEVSPHRSGSGRGVDSASPDGVQLAIKNGLPARTAEIASPCIPPAWGEPLSEADYAVLAASGITPEIVNEAMLRRVKDYEGGEVIGQKGRRNCAGVLFPSYWPGEQYPFNYRLRRDNPDWTVGKDGKPKPDRKYLGPPNSGNRLYIPPGVTLEQLQDVTIPIAIVEGEKKALALWRLARYETERPRFIPVAIAGVWSWRGKIGKANGLRGERIDLKGPIADLGRIQWKDRKVFIVFDTNVHTNDSVKWARKGIARELATRGAGVQLVNLPEDCGGTALMICWPPGDRPGCSNYSKHQCPVPAFISCFPRSSSRDPKGCFVSPPRVSSYRRYSYQTTGRRLQQISG